MITRSEGRSILAKGSIGALIAFWIALESISSREKKNDLGPEFLIALAIFSGLGFIVGSLVGCASLSEASNQNQLLFKPRNPRNDDSQAAPQERPQPNQ